MKNAKNQTIKGILFDLDGVLIFTDHYHYLAWKKLADSLGIPYTEKDNDRTRGVSRMASLEIVLEKYTGKPFTQEEKEAFAAQKNEDYRAYLKQMTPADASEEVRDTLTELRRRGYRLSVGSSSRNAKFILDQTDLTRYFDAIADGNDITRSKPDPEVFEKAAAFIGISAEECAVVEDAVAGLEAARDGGMIPVAIGGAVTSPVAKYTLSTFSDLLKLFD